MSLLDDMCVDCLMESNGAGSCDWHHFMPRLVANIVVAAWMCHAYERTTKNVHEWTQGNALRWRPGCERPMP